MANVLKIGKLRCSSYLVDEFGPGCGGVENVNDVLYGLT